ncbi:hypothetical protein CRI93_08495 [Longimonas halophila]|uniref:Uncharacterized protein n=1 Tax=Longimonas halophila TaxID=1469170 RepID=A0A2H3NL49_9BACT|nr:hypothetical protein CRI93_08495 [Longimonas halophila]
MQEQIVAGLLSAVGGLNAAPALRLSRSFRHHTLHQYGSQKRLQFVGRQCVALISTCTEGIIEIRSIAPQN